MYIFLFETAGIRLSLRLLLSCDDPTCWYGSCCLMTMHVLLSRDVVKAHYIKA